MAWWTGLISISQSTGASVRCHHPTAATGSRRPPTTWLLEMVESTLEKAGYSVSERVVDWGTGGCQRTDSSAPPASKMHSGL
jgi:hypothetical protein